MVTSMRVALIVGGVVIGVVLAIVVTLLAFGRRFRARLRRHPVDVADRRLASAWTGPFGYAPSADPALVELRETYHLDRVAGTGPEIERLVRLMCWTHRLTTHAVYPSSPEEMTGLYLVRSAQEHGKRFNCWMYATVLNDCLLSLGFASRIVHLYPPKEQPKESHYVIAVYSREHHRWIHLDPDMCAYVADEHGTPLGIGEIRQRVVDRHPLRVSDTIHFAHASWHGRRLLKRIYIWYLSKNLFRFQCPACSAPGYETQFAGNVYVQLLPTGYHGDWLEKARRGRQGTLSFCIRDPEVFWAPPDQPSTER